MKILINQLKNVGDVLLATTAIELVRRKYPDAWISLLILPRVAPFFENHPLIDEVIPFVYESKGKSFSSMLNMAKIVRQKKFDVSISLDYRLRPAILVFLAGIKHRIGCEGMDQYRQIPKKVWYRYLFNALYAITNQGHEHQAETFMKAVRPYLSLPDSAMALPSLPISQERNKEKVRKLLNIIEDEPRRKKVLFCVRGTHPEKNWPQDYFARVIDQTRDLHNSDCYIIGAPSDYDYGQEVVAKCEGNVCNLCGKTDPADLKSLCEYADLLVSVDTGTGHICATTKTPVISIFLCTNPVQWRPLSDYATVLCEEFAFERHKLKPTEDCITYKKIEPEHVIREIGKKLI